MKLLLIDDHSLFRDGLSLLIQHRLVLPSQTSVMVLEAADLQQAAYQLRLHSDVRLVLLDLGLADRQGLSNLDDLRAMAPCVPVVVLSADDRPATIMAAIDRGAAGFIPKTVQASVMQEALTRVLAGGVYLPPLPQDAVQMIDALPEPLTGLSDRQLDVLRLLIEGKPNKEICRLLDLSESTVKTHLSAIFRKLRVNSRTQAVVAVARAGVTLGQPALSAR